MLTINKPDYGSIYITADNFDELRSVNATDIRDGVAAIVTGALAIGDGQGGLFTWVSTATEADDDANVIASNDGVAGRWLRLNPIRGEDGEDGEDGTDGIDGTNGIDGVSPLPPVFTIGTVTNLASGSTPTATVTGTSPNFVVNFGLVRGVNGTNGTNATDPNFTIGTVTSLPAGSAATVGLTGTYPTRTLSFGLPRGVDGTNGVSPTVSGVTVNTLPAGANATGSVQSSGGNTYSFTFSIPQGSQGPAGSGTGDMLKTENLSGLSNYGTARSNLGLGSAAQRNAGPNSGEVPVLDASGKLSTSQLPESVLGGMNYKGTWDAAANNVSPGNTTLPEASSSNKGWYYVVATGGSTSVNGITDWKVGDWAVSNGSSYDKVDSSDQVNSVAGLQGSITGPNLLTALGASTAAIGSLTPAANSFPYYTGTTTASTATITAFGRQFVGAADNIAARSLIYAQAYSDNLQALTSFTPVADRLAYYTSSSTAAITTLTTFGRSLIASTDAATARDTLGAMPRKRSIITYTGSATGSLADAEAMVILNYSGAASYTVPLNSSVAFPIGTQIDFQTVGTTPGSISTLSGVTINSVGGKRGFSAQYAGATLIKTGTDTWALVGSLA